MKIVLSALLLLCAFLVCVIIVKVYHSQEKKSNAITNSPVQGYDTSFPSYRVLGGGQGNQISELGALENPLGGVEEGDSMD